MAEFLAGFGISSDVVTIVAIYAIVIIAAFWLAIIIWAYRDMRSRSRDTFAQLGVAIMVALLNLPGLVIYLLLRPRETLGEAYERSLEEEALLQEIEEKPTCPGCGQRTRDTWQVCPHCSTRLKKPCINCHQLLELPWQVCPHCAMTQPGYAAEVPSASQPMARYAGRPSSMPEEPGIQRVRPQAVRSNEPVEFIDSDQPY